jgi:hypothetical protein
MIINKYLPPIRELKVHERSAGQMCNPIEAGTCAQHIQQLEPEQVSDSIVETLRLGIAENAARSTEVRNTQKGFWHGIKTVLRFLLLIA